MKKGIRNFFMLALVFLTGLTIPRLTKDDAKVETKAAETITLYLKTNANWRADGARFAAYTWDPATWYDLTLTNLETEIYEFTIPMNSQANIIFTRMNPAAPLNDWTNKWNQSEDLLIPYTGENNMFVINEGAWGNGGGEVIGYWSKFLPVIVDPSSGDPDPEVPEIEPSIYTLHYWRNDNLQSQYDLWLWGEGQNGQAYPFTGSDSYGRVLQVASTYFTNPQYLNLIIRPGSWSAQTPDIKIDVQDYPAVDDGTGTKRRHFYLVDMETTVYKTAEEAKGEKLLSARFTGTSELTVQTYKEPLTYSVSKAGSALVNGNVTANYIPAAFRYEFKINIGETVDLTALYEVTVTFKETGTSKVKNATFDGLYDNAFFIDNMTYTGSDLGVTYTPQNSTFKVWAPTSEDVKIRIYDNGTPRSVSKELGNDLFVEHQMIRGEKGVWSLTLNGDLHGKYYTLVAKNSLGTNEFPDPYAKAAGVNGIRGMIVDFTKTNPTGWDSVTTSTKKATEVVPYELHVSDLTADDTWNGTEANRKKFLGLIEEGTMYQENGQAVRTGFDHIKELGINALQILPFYDQENDETNMEFNWGYNPKNYNVLEGGYSSDPHNGLVRIQEFKQVVQAYAALDIRIIMDVVYNHVASISQHSFNKLVPGYYFRYSGEAPSNASGVGNDTASERIMFERYMVDSTYFWATEYKLGGFRFDLMGLHTVDAMNSVINKLKTYRSDIIVYGEPWDMDGTVMSVRKDLAKHANLWKTAGVGGFNDQIRDAIKGSSSGSDRGWVQLGVTDINEERVNKIKDGVMGKVTGGVTNPSQVVNYISVHDNYAIFDKLQVAGKNLYDIDRIKRQSVQAEAISLLGQGIGFIHAGSEIMRSKPLGGGYFDHNSYQSPYEVNSIKWDEKMDNLEYHNLYRQMIALKRHAQSFNYSTRTEVDGKAGVSTIGNNLLKLTYSDGQDSYVIYHYGVGGRRDVIDLGGQELVVDTSGTLKPGTVLPNSFRIEANTTIIARNVRDRGANDLTMPNDITLVPFVDPDNPTSEEPTSGDTTSMPPTTSLPGDSTDPNNPGGPNNALKTTLIIGGSVLGVGVIAGAVFLILKVIKKKK
ncbi:MAG: type I pullulanase [Bacilli bacterium]|nr:type I pullulanase [Bacilli bacterium]